VQPILALLVNPVGANPMQYMIEKAFAHHNLDWRYLTLEVAPEDLSEAVRGMRAMGFRGGSVAAPHQQAVVALLSQATEKAALIGSANVILRQDDRLIAENTEAKGVIESLRHLTDPTGKRFLVLGAGETARAIVIELAAAGAAEIRILNRTASRALELASLVAGKYSITVSGAEWQGECQVPPEIDVLVQATSITCNDPDAHVPVAAESLRAELTVVDTTFAPPHTRLLREASSHGCKTLDGLTSLVEQVAFDFRLWTEIDPDRQVLRDAIEEFLEL
jgi:shikimate dehydrogenase